MGLVGAALENFLLENQKKIFLAPCKQLKLGEWAWLHVNNLNWVSGPRRMWLFPNSLPRLFYPISFNVIFIKLDPRGKECVMNTKSSQCWPDSGMGTSHMHATALPKLQALNS
jgi:hypothetical protein